MLSTQNAQPIKQCYKICFVKEDNSDIVYLTSDLNKESLEDLAAWVQFKTEEYFEDDSNAEVSLSPSEIAELIVLFSDSDICEKQLNASTIETYYSRELRAEQWYDGNLERFNDFIGKYNGSEDIEEVFLFSTEPTYSLTK